MLVSDNGLLHGSRLHPGQSIQSSIQDWGIETGHLLVFGLKETALASFSRDISCLSMWSLSPWVAWVTVYSGGDCSGSLTTAGSLTSIQRALSGIDEVGLDWPH